MAADMEKKQDPELPFSESGSENNEQNNIRNSGGSILGEEVDEPVKKKARCTLKGCCTKVLQLLQKYRNFIGFWIIGLCNNFPYVIMLSAAFDIIAKIEQGSTPTNTTTNFTVSACQKYNYTDDNGTDIVTMFPPRICHAKSTGVILLADILPTLAIKATFPWFMHVIPYWIRVSVCVIASLASFILVATFDIEAVVILGVVCASVGSGFGEIVFLSFTSFFDKSTVSAWSSGTGAAGIGGALVYLALTTWIGLTPSIAIYLQLVIPIILLLSFLFIIKRPKKEKGPEEPEGKGAVSEEEHPIAADDKAPLLPSNAHEQKPAMKFLSKLYKQLLYQLWLILPLLWFMIPLFVVYVGEYLINQGLFELIYYPDTRGAGTTCFNQDDQYRWYQTVYQLGVFVSRSSVKIVAIRHVWIFAVLQMCNFAFFFCEAVYQFLPSFWLMIALVLWEGLLGGATYVNAFYHIAKEAKPKDKEFSMGIASVSDTCGITVAGICSIYVHNYICNTFVNNYQLVTSAPNSTLTTWF